ncbi:MAG: segregation/condensation protein A [Candidatus Aenigmarchaeota archaeon]|nr:segregation/condensation protein A [Candidatus Aenigmarchaeota archaeon]
MLDEKKILGFITSEYSWEQIIYEIIAWEGLDPWDLDINKLADGFIKYMKAIENLDFRLPAKFIMVAAVLLKMKSEYLRSFKDQITREEEEQLQEELNEIEEEMASEDFRISPLEIPPRREPVRPVSVTELVYALKKALKSHERKIKRREKLKKAIVVKGDNLNERIKYLYAKINTLLERIRKKEVEFSKLVDRWEREEVVNNFVPLIHLEHQQKVACRQEELFNEIWISRRGKK